MKIGPLKFLRPQNLISKIFFTIQVINYKLQFHICGLESFVIFNFHAFDRFLIGQHNQTVRHFLPDHMLGDPLRDLAPDSEKSVVCFFNDFLQPGHVRHGVQFRVTEVTEPHQFFKIHKESSLGHERIDRLDATLRQPVIDIFLVLNSRFLKSSDPKFLFQKLCFVKSYPKLTLFISFFESNDR